MKAAIPRSTTPGNSELANLTVSKAKCGLNLREASQTQFLVALGGA